MVLAGAICEYSRLRKHLFLPYESSSYVVDFQCCVRGVPHDLNLICIRLANKKCYKITITQTE